MRMEDIWSADPEVGAAVAGEIRRQADHLEMIASENFVSEAVLEAAGSVFTNKYAEGYPGRRYYGGCVYADTVETLARERAKALFGADHANVQPHSGSQANMAVYMCVLQPGDTALGMNLSHGGHLTHGHPLSFSGKLYNFIAYGVKKETETIDYEALEGLMKEHRPKLAVVGASAYSRFIDFEKIWKRATKYDVLVMVDMAHIAGLVAAGVHPSPVPFAHFVTTTTHKTLRGPRGVMVLCSSKFSYVASSKSVDALASCFGVLSSLGLDLPESSSARTLVGTKKQKSQDVIKNSFSSFLSFIFMVISYNLGIVRPPSTAITFPVQ